jgi:CheY-like chemotaxis protein
MTQLVKKPDLDQVQADVLVVEDESLMSALLKRYIGNFAKDSEKKRLRDAPLEELRVSSHESGWELLEKDLSQVKVAIIDLLTPRLNGVDFIRNLRKRYPHIRIIPISGMATEVMKRNLKEIMPRGIPLLAKPLRREEFNESFIQAWNIQPETLLVKPKSEQPSAGPGPSEVVEAQSEPLWTAFQPSNPKIEVSILRKGLFKGGKP